MATKDALIELGVINIYVYLGDYIRIVVLVSEKIIVFHLI
jgi:hypothetical protein